MFVIEYIRKNQKAGIAVAVLLGVAAVGLAAFNLSRPNPSDLRFPYGVFFSADNGKTYFTDNKSIVPPYVKDGKTAVLAQVYSCNGGKTTFVGLLLRYTPEGKQKLEAAIARGDNPVGLKTALSNSGDLEIKRPGDPDSAWVSIKNMAGFQAAAQIRCPDGKQDDLEQIHAK